MFLSLIGLSVAMAGGDDIRRLNGSCIAKKRGKLVVAGATRPGGKHRHHGRVQTLILNSTNIDKPQTTTTKLC
jgi:hypothetical protein